MVFIYEDEYHTRNYEALHVIWNLKGRQKQLSTYGHHAIVSLLEFFFDTPSLSSVYIGSDKKTHNTCV